MENKQIKIGQKCKVIGWEPSGYAPYHIQAVLEVIPEEAISKMETTEKPEQKFPEVGRSYRQIKDHNWIAEVKELVTNNRGDILGVKTLYKNMIFEDSIEGFKEHFEEIEDHKEEEKPPEKFREEKGKIREEAREEKVYSLDELLKKNKKGEGFALFGGHVLKLTDIKSESFPPKESEGSAVDKALEELPKTEFSAANEAWFNLKTWLSFGLTPDSQLKELAQNLVNALEEEKKKESRKKSWDKCRDAMMKGIKLPVYQGHDWAMSRTSVDENGEIKVENLSYEDVYKKPKESLDGSTIPQTPVSGISDYTEKEENSAGMNPVKGMSYLEKIPEAGKLLFHFPQEWPASYEIREGNAGSVWLMAPCGSGVMIEKVRLLNVLKKLFEDSF